MERRVDIRQLDILELREAVKRERGRAPTLPQDRKYGVDFWLNKCLEDGLGGDPYVQEIYQNRHSKPVPSEYLQPRENST